MNNESNIENQESLNNNEIQTPVTPEPVSSTPVTSVPETPVPETVKDGKSTNFKTIIILAVILVAGIIGFIITKSVLKDGKSVVNKNANHKVIKCSTKDMDKFKDGYVKEDYYYSFNDSLDGWHAEAYAKYNNPLVISIAGELCTYVDGKPIVDMSNMFKGLSNLERIDLSSFNTSNVINMSNMFNAFALRKLYLSGFDTSHVTDANYMFKDCDSLPDSIKNDPRFN